MSYPEPTREQLVNFIAVRIQHNMPPGMLASKPLINAMLDEQPHMEESWREQHRVFQRLADSLCKHCGGAGSVELSSGVRASCLRCGGKGLEQ